MVIRPPEHLSRIEHRIFQPERPQEIIALANESAAVQNQLISPELAAYHMAWCELVNSDHQDHKQLSIAGGPDLATSLYTADATDVNVVDLATVNKERLETIQHTGHVRDWKFSGTINTRLFKGYYPEPSIRDPNIGMESLLLHELEKLGIAEKFNLTQNNGVIRIEFDWTYPGQKQAKTRRFSFHALDLHNLPNTDLFPDASVDSIIQKAGFQSRISDNARYLSWLKGRLVNGGHMLLDILKPEPDGNPDGTDEHFANARKLLQALPPGMRVQALDKKSVQNIFQGDIATLGYGSYMVVAEKK